MPRSEPQDTEAVTFRIGRDVLALLRSESLAEGQARGSGRIYNPSGTLDRILRAHYADKLKAKGRTK